MVLLVDPGRQGRLDDLGEANGPPVGAKGLRVVCGMLLKGSRGQALEAVRADVINII
jgi:hypothetical protein